MLKNGTYGSVEHIGNNLLVVMLLLAVLFNSCEEEYWPNLGNKYEHLLVVDGMITNGPAPYTVRLSFSTDIRNPVFIPVKDCEVIISDDVGNSEQLTETDDGVYKTDPDGIRGVIGRSYKLIIHRSDGKTYESDFEKLPAPVGIDSVYPRIEYKDNPDFPFPIPGYQFYISTKQADDKVNYLYWQLEQTFEYKVDFLIYYYYDGVLHNFPKHDSLQTCWKTDAVKSIFVSSTENLSQPVIQNFPLQYMSFDTREFSIRYSLLVNQLTISRKSYEFWKDVNEQNTQGGTFFTQLPYQVQGNVYNAGDKSEPVPGYFLVAGIDSSRIFVDRPPPTVPMYYTFCKLEEADYLDYGMMFKVNDPNEWPKYVTVDVNGARAVPNRLCADCRERGGTVVKPDFWIDAKDEK